MSNKSLLSLTLAETQKGLHDKSFSSTELTGAYLDRIEETKELNIYVTTTPEQALRRAKESDGRLAAGTAGLLEGLPIAVKDVFCTKDIRTTVGSHILSNFIPPYESAITDRLWLQGAVLLGKTNLDEFCMGSTTTTSAFGATANPWNPVCVAGGSSGGSAAAVASGAALAAIGTDTGGSVRQPASFCGVVGLKPTYGRCSRWGMVAFSSSLDQAGPLTRTVSDSALFLQVMAGHDPRDATCATNDVPHFMAAIGRSVKGLRVGIPKEWHDKRMDPEILELWEKGQDCLKEAGCTIVEVSLPYTSYALPCYYTLVCAEAASNLERYDGIKYGLRVEADTLAKMYEYTRGKGFGQEVKRRILIGTYILAHGYFEAYYGRAQKVRRLISHDFEKVFEQVDVLLSPTTPTPAFPLDEAAKDPVTVYWNDVLTVPANIGGVCALSVPFSLSSTGLPLGLQLVAPAFAEETLFQFGHVLEQGAPFISLVNQVFS